MSIRRNVVTVLLSCLSLVCQVTVAIPAASQPELSDFVSRVLAENPGVQAAQAAFDAALARQKAAGKPLFNPELELDAETAETDSAFIGISQTIDWTNKRGARSSVTEFERFAVAADLANTRQTLATELLAAIADYQTASELDKLAQRRQEIMARFANLADRRRRAGDLGKVELDLARLAHIEAQLQKAAIAVSRSQARQALAAVLGRIPDGLPPFSTDLPELMLDTGRIDSLLNGLPELQAQRNRLAATRSMVQLRTRERRADPTIGIRGGREENDNLVGISLSVPLFVRNSFRAEVDAANADLAQAQQIGANTHRRAKAQLVSSAERYRIVHDAWDQWIHSGQLSLDSQIALLQQLWEAGELSTTDYLVQLRQALDTQASATELQGQMWNAWVAWLAASGQVETWLQIGEQKP